MSVRINVTTQVGRFYRMGDDRLLVTLCRTAGARQRPVGTPLRRYVRPSQLMNLDGHPEKEVCDAAEAARIWGAHMLDPPKRRLEQRQVTPVEQCSGVTSDGAG